MPRIHSLTLIVLTVAGCVTVSKSVLLDRSAHPVPQEEVTLLLATDSIPSRCQRFALWCPEGIGGGE